MYAMMQKRELRCSNEAFVRACVLYLYVLIKDVLIFRILAIFDNAKLMGTLGAKTLRIAIRTLIRAFVKL